ncbi:MAG: DUF3138 family protein [Aquabacterium sp.]
MIRHLQPAALALALAAAFPAQAQSNADVLRELQALKAKVEELESKLKAQEAKQPQWGMTQEQSRELSRVATKAEALEDQRDASGFKGLRIAGYIDPTFIYNKAQNRAGAQFLNTVASDGYNYDNSYFGAVSLDFIKETESGTRYRLTMVPNRGTDSVIGNGGLIHEASVSIPLSDLQTRFIAGHVPDWSGYEYLQPTLNKLITHNLLFDFTLPTSYTGAGFDVTSGKWIVKGILGNMNASKNPAGQRSPMVAYRVDYSRGEFQGFGFAGVHGKAPNFADPTGQASNVQLFEFDAYFIRGDWTIQGQLTYGSQKKASIVPDPVTGELRTATWKGISGLAAYKLSPRLEAIARVDHLRNSRNGGGLLGYTGYWDPANGSLGDNRNGIGVDPTLDCVTDATIAACNRGASRTALSFGLNYLFDLNTTFKLEYRADRSDLPMFLYVKDGVFKKTNSLFGASVLVAF